MSKHDAINELAEVLRAHIGHANGLLFATSSTSAWSMRECAARLRVAADLAEAAMVLAEKREAREACAKRTAELRKRDPE